MILVVATPVPEGSVLAQTPVGEGVTVTPPAGDVGVGVTPGVGVGPPAGAATIEIAFEPVSGIHTCDPTWATPWISLKAPSVTGLPVATDPSGLKVETEPPESGAQICDPTSPRDSTLSRELPVMVAAT